MNAKNGKNPSPPHEGKRFEVELKKVLYFCIAAAVAIAVLYFILE